MSKARILAALAATVFMGAAVFTGCGGQAPATPAPKTASPEAPQPAQHDDVPAMRKFAAVKIGPYDVQPMFEEEIENGHFNIKVTGGEFKAVRGWVGTEDASGVMIVKTEIENDYRHGHYEVPDPIPADVKFWIEIESPSGETFKGSTPLAMVP